MGTKTQFLIFTILFVFNSACCAQEKIHLHLDKDIYLPGETVWFKAYIIRENLPSYQSTNFYLSVYDDYGKLLQSKHYPIFDGTSYGDFIIPDSVKSHTLRLRVFTKGMWDTTESCERVVTVFQQQRAKMHPSVPGSNLKVEFYPEGGNAVAGLQNLIAIKATDENNEPLEIRGIISEAGSGVFVDSFFTNIYGVGTIIIKPEISKNYIANWKRNNGPMQITKVFSDAKPGVLFHCEKLKNMLYCNIAKNSNEENFNMVKLTANWAGQTVLSARKEMAAERQWVYKIPLDSLPEGIITLIVSDINNEIIQQRMIINTGAASSSKPVTELLQKSLLPKGENKIILSMPDSLQYNLSVSVADISFYEQENHRSIEQDLYLSKDILPDEKVTAKILKTSPGDKTDELLVTARPGLKASAVIAGNIPLDNYLTLLANYSNKQRSLPSDDNIKLIISDSLPGKQFYKLTPYNQNGFIKEGLIFFDSAKINYQLVKNKEETEFIGINTKQGYTAPVFIAPIQFLKTDTVSGMIKDSTNNIVFDFAGNKSKKFNEEQTIREVVVKTRYTNPETKRMLELDNKYTSGMFSGIARGYQLNVIDDKNAWSHSDVLNYIVYRVPGLGIFRLHGERFLGDPRSKTKILTFLNEVELTDQTGLESISMTQVAYIKYITGIVVGSSFTSTTGVLYIYTKKGDEVEADEGVEMKKVKLKGYDMPKGFTSPDYSDKVNLLNSDMRTTLYWNPAVMLDKLNNKFEIRFNNNDVSKRLLLTIEGFTEDGRLIHIEKLIEN